MLSIITVIGFVCCEHKSERIIEIDKETTKETINEDNRTIETETDKDGDTNQAIQPTETETETETEVEVEVEVEDKIEDEVEPLFYLSDYERWVVECIVMGEACGEPYEGQVLVAQCILNGCLRKNIQPSELRVANKYSGWRENPSDSVKRAVSAVFDDGYKVTDEFVLYFYAPKYSKGKWHETQRFVIELGGHRFFTVWDE